jgi:serine protease Do
MTRAFADSLGMVEPCGAIFGQPRPDSPAAQAGIEAGDVVTAINGKLSRDFAAIISVRAVAHERELPLFETIVAIDLYQSLKRMFSL